MKKGALRKKTALALLAVIMLCGLAARLHGMNRYSLWFDEYFHAFAAQGILEKGEPVLPSGELYGRASVYSYLVAAGFKLFGTGDIPARMPSVLLGVLSIGLTYMLASHWFSRRVGLISAFLMALSPFCILWSQMCRLYALFQPAYLLLVFFFFRLFEERISFASVLLLCMAGIFSMHVHEFTVLFLPVVFVYCLVMLCVSLAQRGGDGVFRLRYLLVTAVCVTAGLVTLCLKGGGFLSGLMSVPIWGRDVAANYNFYREMISKMYPVFTYMAPIAVLALIARKGREGLYTALNFIVPFVILSILTWKAYRYVYFIWPFFMIIAAGLLDYGLSALGTLRARLMRAAGSFGRQRLVGSCVSALIFLGALYPLTMPWIRMEPHEYRRFDIYDFSQEAQLIRELSWEEIIITTESLLLEFYTGRKPDYVIHIQEFGDQGRDGEYVLRDARGREFEKRSGVPLIKTRSMLEKVELAGRPVWIVANRNFFLGTGSRRRIDEGLRDYIVNSYRKLRKSEDVIEIYRKE